MKTKVTEATDHHKRSNLKQNHQNLTLRTVILDRTPNPRTIAPSCDRASALIPTGIYTLLKCLWVALDDNGTH